MALGVDCGLWFYEPKIAFVLDFRISDTKLVYYCTTIG